MFYLRASRSSSSLRRQAREPEVRQAALAVAAALSSLVEATDPLPAEVPASSAATIARSARAGSTGSLADDSPGVLLFNLYPASDPRPPFAPVTIKRTYVDARTLQWHQFAQSPSVMKQSFGHLPRYRIQINITCVRLSLPLRCSC